MYAFNNALRLAKQTRRNYLSNQGRGFGPGHGLGPRDGDGTGNCVNKLLTEESDNLTNEELDMSRLIASLIEELEAIAFYAQRDTVSTDQNIKDLMIHNHNEEVEHAVMLLAEIANRNPIWHSFFSKFLFKKEDVTKIEKEI